jgi:hypothetical protein
MKAKPLEWIGNITYSFDKLVIAYTEKGVKNGRSLLMLDGHSEGEFQTLDAAKAHAEQIHRAAWAELIEKWGVKDE